MLMLVEDASLSRVAARGQSATSTSEQPALILHLATKHRKLKVKGLKEHMALHEMSPITELRGVTCHMGSHSVTCHPTQVNTPCLKPSQ